VEESVAMKISGHDPQHARRYNIISDVDVQEAMVKVTEYVSMLPTENQVVSLTQAKAGSTAS
jgi:hypothetical protein